MAVYRKPYRSGTSVVVAIPYYMLEDLNVEPGDYFKVERLRDNALRLTPVTAESRNEDRYASAGTWRAPVPEIVAGRNPEGAAGGTQQPSEAGNCEIDPDGKTVH
jgi:antitoxin component of MazEF toxin-antitoxin module